jgi:hypothetical protein
MGLLSEKNIFLGKSPSVISQIINRLMIILLILRAVVAKNQAGQKVTFSDHQASLQF